VTTDTMELHRQHITSKAKAARPGPALLMLLTGLFMGLGWVLGTLGGVLWFCVAWAWYAAAEGLVTGWNSRPRVTAPPG
jgi:hypothetical protein